MNIESMTRWEPESDLRLRGRVLFLTKDLSLIRQQIVGQSLDWVNPNDLLDDVSTDNIIPNHACYSSRTTDQLAEYTLTGLPSEAIRKGELKNGGFEAIVAGRSFGRGSSREHAQLALIGSGINFLVAENFERIFGENCRNYGLLTVEGKRADLVRKLLSRESIHLAEFLADLDSLDKQIMTYGGLLDFTRARLEGRVHLDSPVSPPRPMTLTEKIIASHATNDPNQTHTGVESVEPGQTRFVRIDQGYGYELQTHVCLEGIRRVFGDDFTINHSEKFYFFDDHLALLDDDSNAIFLRETQHNFASRSGAKIYGYDPRRGVEGICHTVMLEKYALPGQLIVGNDSHTCTLGAVGALAIGKGTSELAASFVTNDIAIKVPETIKFNLDGQLRGGVTSKDLVLYILSLPQLKDSLGSGRVFEYSGAALDTLSFDEQVVLANMAIEGNAFTGIIEPNPRTVDYLLRRTHLTREEIEQMIIRSDPKAQYAGSFDIDLQNIEPMIALPGDPQKGIPLSHLKDVPTVDIAYIGSCTGGKLEDLQRAAIILDGQKVAESVQLYIQASSQSILKAARELGLVDVFEHSGATVLLPGCGACMNAGPGASQREDQVTISDTNRNFYGRMGKGHTYLANVEVVSASAVKGQICSPLDL